MKETTNIRETDFDLGHKAGILVGLVFAETACQRVAKACADEGSKLSEVAGVGVDVCLTTIRQLLQALNQEEG